MHVPGTVLVLKEKSAVRARNPSEAVVRYQPCMDVKFELEGSSLSMHAR